MSHHHPDTVSNEIVEALSRLESNLKKPVIEAIRQKLDRIPSAEVIWNLAMVGAVDKSVANNELVQEVARVTSGKPAEALIKRLQVVSREQLEAVVSLVAA